MKNLIFRRELSKKGLGQFSDLRGGGGAWQERGGVFEGGLIPPMYTMVKSMDMDGIFLKLAESFLSNRYQHVVLKGQVSFWTDIKGVLQVQVSFIFSYLHHNSSENLSRLYINVSCC